MPASSLVWDLCEQFVATLSNNCFNVRLAAHPPAKQTPHRCDVDIDADVDDDTTIDVKDDHDETTMV